MGFYSELVSVAVNESCNNGNRTRYNSMYYVPVNSINYNMKLLYCSFKQPPMTIVRTRHCVLIWAFTLTFLENRETRFNEKAQNAPILLTIAQCAHLQ